MKERKKEKEKERKVYKGIMERNESKWRKIRSIEETLGILETEDKEAINVHKRKRVSLDHEEENKGVSLSRCFFASCWLPHRTSFSVYQPRRSTVVVENFPRKSSQIPLISRATTLAIAPSYDELISSSR